jgi:translation initiation factor IF-1
MVKNTTGGSKAKGQARKFTTAKASNTLRISQDDSEVYAQVIKVLGGSMCHALGVDGITRLCHIRGKFRGRGKRDNFISPNTWILIGLREWEAEKESLKGKLINCDLLEVYNDHDKDRLKNTITSIDWSVFIANDTKTSSLAPSAIDDTFEFSDERGDEFRQLIESQISQSRSNPHITVDEEIIDIDDI